VPVLEQRILALTEAIWEATLGVNLQVGTMPVNIDWTHGFWTGRVEISGSWNGVVLLHGSDQLIHTSAAVIFASGHSEITDQDRRDAMYELTKWDFNNGRSAHQAKALDWSSAMIRLRDGSICRIGGKGKFPHIHVSGIGGSY
jgi:hypothetical protein